MKSTNNIVALRQLWKQCFDADSSFLDLYFGKGSGLFETYTIEDGPDIISALSVLPVEYQGHRGGYIYGVCTSPLHRGHGHAINLLRQAEEDCTKNKGMEFFILRPASQSLFRYYRRQGYSKTIYRQLRILDLPQFFHNTPYKNLTGETLFQMRRKYHQDSGFFEWSPAVCNYIIDYIGYCHGKAMLLQGTYIIGYPDPENTDYFICEEAGLTHDNTGTILSAIRTAYPNMTKIIIPCFQQQAGEEFMLCKTSGCFKKGNPVFSFTME